MTTMMSTCVRALMRIFLLCSALVLDIACFYTSTVLLVPLSICVYASALTYAPASFITIAFFSIALLPVVISVSWPLFIVPLLCITLFGLTARSLLFTLWPLPYVLVGIYALIQYGLCLIYPTALLLVPRLTILSFLVILIVIKISSLISSVHPRQGNRI